MQNDEIIWRVIGSGFCSFKAKTESREFCRNEYNVDGLCCRTSCPLANSYYATVIEEKGKCYLYLKTIERAHMPAKLWEKIKLSNNYEKALEQIDTAMKNVYKDFQINRCKHRLTRIRQTLIRARRLAVKPQEKLVVESRRTARREMAREKKAEKAAHLETSLEKALLNRLKQGVYSELYNFPQQETEKEATTEVEELENIAEAEMRGNVEYVEDEDDEQEDLEDLEDFYDDEDEEDDDEGEESDGEGSDADGDREEESEEDESPTKVAIPKSSAKRKRSPVRLPPRRGPRIEIEYEYEPTTETV